jgi:acyl-ACP thioesterase
MKMSTFESIHTESFDLHTSDLDPTNTARVPYYFNIMQEAAGNHSHQYNLTIPDLLKQGKTWLISKQKLKIYSYPSWPGRLTIETWVLPPSRLISPRGSITRDENGKLVFESLSYWCVLDLERRRPVPISTVGEFPGLEHPDFSLDHLIGKPAGLFDSPEQCYLFNPQIQYRDTDINGHVNNNSYVEWCLESLPVEMRRAQNPSYFEIHYQRETYMNDTVEVQTHCSPETSECRHTITALREGQRIVVCQGTSIWEPRHLFKN